MPSSTSTSGRATLGMNPWRKALYVSLISRWDSAAIVPKTNDDLPDPETPVKTVSRRLGISTVTPRRLLTRAPDTWITSWASAGCSGGTAAGRSEEGIRVIVRLSQRAEPTHSKSRW